MAIEDRIKWDKKYKTSPSLLEKRPASKKLEALISKVEKGKALDLACGGGRNSVFMAKMGFNVDALDISKEALDNIDKKAFPNITTKCIDLEGFIPAKNSYDLIVMTNYLDREVIPHLIDALKKEGVLLIETYMAHKDNTKPNPNPDFLLQAGELKKFLKKGLELLDYEEFDNEPWELYRMKKQSIIVRKL